VSEIVWLASYPKSGNTWLRVLLTNYLRDEDEPASINDLMGGPIASARTWFDEWVGVEASALDEDTVDRLRPDVYRCLAADSKETLFMKVHDAWTQTDADEPMFPADVTSGVVYIVRNPLDMVASLANHYGGSVDEAVARLIDPRFGMRGAAERLGQQLRQRLGAWDFHVRSWLDQSGLPVHLLRYEDLRRDTETTFTDVLRFLRLDIDQARITKAVAFSSLAEMQRQEAKTGFRERLTRSPGFFRRGDVVGWNDELSTETVARLAASLGETMRRLGYEGPTSAAAKMS
jgi:aryl sulfotransferase